MKSLTEATVDALDDDGAICTSIEKDLTYLVIKVKGKELIYNIDDDVCIGTGSAMLANIEDYEEDCGEVIVSNDVKEQLKNNPNKIYRSVDFNGYIQIYELPETNK